MIIKFPVLCWYGLRSKGWGLIFLVDESHPNSDLNASLAAILPLQGWDCGKLYDNAVSVVAEPPPQAAEESPPFEEEILNCPALKD
jgi:hypothetical protein